MRTKKGAKGRTRIETSHKSKLARERLKMKDEGENDLQDKRREKEIDEE